MTDGRELPPIIDGIPGRERPRERIGHTAPPVGRSGDEFVLNAARDEPLDLALDQVFFPLSGPAFAEFQALLDNPPAPNGRLRRLLLTKAPWE